jgi:dGTP triphosphohydrolase
LHFAISIHIYLEISYTRDYKTIKNNKKKKMANEKKSIIEEALLEAQKIDATFKSNAKEILAQTMSSEIEEMVKESLSGSRFGLMEDEDDEEVAAPAVADAIAPVPVLAVDAALTS